MQQKIHPHPIENDALQITSAFQDEDMHFQDTSGQNFTSHEVFEIDPERMLKRCPLSRILMIFVDVKLNDQFCMSDGLLLLVWGELIEVILCVFTSAVVLSMCGGCYLWRWREWWSVVGPS